MYIISLSSVIFLVITQELYRLVQIKTQVSVARGGEWRGWLPKGVKGTGPERWVRDRWPAGVRVTHSTHAVGLHVSPTPLVTHQLHPHAHNVNNAHYWHTWYLKQYQKNWVLNIASQGIRLPYCWQAGRQQMWQPACDSVGCTWAWGCGRGGDASLASRPRLSGCNNGFIKAQQREAERPSVPITEKVQ